MNMRNYYRDLHPEYFDMAEEELEEVVRGLDHEIMALKGKKNSAQYARMTLAQNDCKQFVGKTFKQNFSEYTNYILIHEVPLIVYGVDSIPIFHPDELPCIEVRVWKNEDADIDDISTDTVYRYEVEKSLKGNFSNNAPLIPIERSEWDMAYLGVVGKSIPGYEDNFNKIFEEVKKAFSEALGSAGAIDPTVN